MAPRELTKDQARARLKTLALRRNDIKKELEVSKGTAFEPIFQQFLDENIKEAQELYQKTVLTPENFERWKRQQEKLR